jgi:tetratricopeptide (TPR) repeat protein
VPPLFPPAAGRRSLVLLPASGSIEARTAARYCGRVSARARTALLVAALAALAAVVVAGAVMLSADEAGGPAAEAERPRPRAGFPPLALSLGIRDDAEARQLRRAAELYDAGRRAEAGRVFARFDSLEAKLGAAFAAWPATEDRIEQLGALYPRSALVQLHVGLARFWAGTGGALTAWREARDVEPDTPYAVRADDLIHPELAPGLPVFTPSFAYRVEGDSPAHQLAALRADESVRGRLLYGIALQRLGRPLSARRAFAGALELEPNGVDPLVADAVGRYEKSDPSSSFSRLGPLTRRFPTAATVRFHLGVLLLWQRDVEEAARQLRLARKADPGSRLAREAGRYLDEVVQGGTG